MINGKISINQIATGQANSKQGLSGHINTKQSLSGTISNIIESDNPYAEYGENFVKMLNGETNHFEVPDVVEHLSKNYYSFPTNILSIRGNGVKTTDTEFFKEATIERADLPNLQAIPHYAFQNCGYLTEINIPLATSIGIYAFDNTQSLIDVKFPKVKSIGDYSFRYSFVQSIEAPETEIVYPYAFMEAYNLMTAYFPSAKDLRIGAFSGCYSLMSVTLGAVENTAMDNFEYCFMLTDLTVGEGTTASLYLVDTDLTQESLHSIIDNYADMNGKESPTFNVGEYNLSKIDPTYLEKLERKNINYQ